MTDSQACTERNGQYVCWHENAGHAGNHYCYVIQDRKLYRAFWADRYAVVKARRAVSIRED